MSSCYSKKLGVDHRWLAAAPEPVWVAVEDDPALVEQYV